jgi:polar amino acid transport system permease protein
VGIIKDTPMLATIGVVELMQSANTVGSLTYRFLEPYTMVGVIFLIISLPTAFGLRKLESMVSRRQGISKQ